jgi:hypothetical protein
MVNTPHLGVLAHDALLGAHGDRVPLQALHLLLVGDGAHEHAGGLGQRQIQQAQILLLAAALGRAGQDQGAAHQAFVAQGNQGVAADRKSVV